MKKEISYTEIYKILSKKIRKDYGPRCKEFALGCFGCQKHYLMLDVLQDCVDIEKYKDK